MSASSASRLAGFALAALAAALVIATAAAPDLHYRLGGWVLIALFALGGLAAYAGARLAELMPPRTALLVILLAALGMRVTLLITDPYLSSDIYRYVWDGRVQAAGINPYRYVPAAPELAHLRDAAIFPYINRADYAPTIYPPVAQAIYLAVTRLGESVLVMKAGLLAFEAAAIWALLALLQRLGAPITRVALYAWHPLPAWEIAGNGHVDAAMLAFLLLAVLVFLNGRALLAGVLAALGALVKPVAILALPVFWRPWDWRLPLAVAATVLLAYLPYLSVGTGALGFLPAYLAEEGITTGSGFKLLWLLQQATGPFKGAAALYLAAALLILAGLALAAVFRTDRSDAAALRALNALLIAFLVLSSPHYPWYFIVLVPFLALTPTAVAWVLTLGGVLFYDVVPGDTLPGYEARIALFTLAMLAALAHDLWRERRKLIAVPAGEVP